MAVHPDTDNPDRFAPGRVMSTESGVALTVERSQQRPGSLLVRFHDVVDRTAAETLAGERLFIEASERRSLEPEEYWPEDLIGLEARSTDGQPLGRIESVIEGAAQFRILVRGESGSFEVPFVQALVPEVDLSAGIVVIETIEGLVPEN